MSNPVPPAYYGVWRRTLLTQNGMNDTSSFVLWLQTERYHADIRIPANRPSFDHIEQLEDCTPEQLVWLSTQQGFTGTTYVNGNVVEWQREFDFQPKQQIRDIAVMQFQTNRLVIETGIEANYLEEWEKISDSHLNLSAHNTFSFNRFAEKVDARLLTANKLFALVRPRRALLPRASSLQQAIRSYQPNKSELLNWLDFEISFGELTAADMGTITHSTLPFREGKQIPIVLH